MWLKWNQHHPIKIKDKSFCKIQTKLYISKNWSEKNVLFIYLANQLEVQLKPVKMIKIPF